MAISGITDQGLAGPARRAIHDAAPGARAQDDAEARVNWLAYEHEVSAWEPSIPRDALWLAGEAALRASGVSPRAVAGGWTTAWQDRTHRQWRDRELPECREIAALVIAGELAPAIDRLAALFVAADRFHDTVLAF